MLIANILFGGFITPLINLPKMPYYTFETGHRLASNFYETFYVPLDQSKFISKYLNKDMYSYSNKWEPYADEIITINTSRVSMVNQKFSIYN